jgi:hypothetical protein
MSTWVFLQKRAPWYLRSLMRGWLIAGIPGLIWLAPYALDLAVPIAIAMALTLLVTKIAYMIEGSKPKKTYWIIKGILALLASLPALQFWP